MNISVITPSVRPEMLEIVDRCLSRQTTKEFEWVLAIPYPFPVIKFQTNTVIAREPDKRMEDYYGLNKAFNAGLKKSQGELIVFILDGLWFPPDLLERLWNHYQLNPKSCVTCIGHQYDQITHGKPEHMVWRDPRARTDFGSFYEVSPTEMEFCIASLSKKGIIEVGGFDETFDKYAALSEKELCFRMDRVGYKFFIDQTLEYRAIKHPRLSSEWDERYNQGCLYYQQCLRDIHDGKRLVLDFLK